MSEKMAVQKFEHVDERVLHNFAKRLANNEPRARKNALKKLKGWMEARSDAFGNDEFLKVWKGLHYCMWMADKPCIQEELADRMSEFVHCFKNFETSACFISAFFATEAREWSRIDRLRMDKFMMRRGWLSSDVSCLANILHLTVLDGLNDHIPDGIRFHLNDIFIDELDRIASNSQLSGQGVVQLLVPFCRLIAKSANKVLVNYTAKTVFEFLLARMSGDGLSSDVQVDIQQLVQQFTRLAAKRGCKNRACIYRLLNRLRDDKKLVNDCQMKVNGSVVDADADTDAAVRLAVENGIQSLAAAASDCSKQRKQKRRVAQMNGSTDDADDVEKISCISANDEEETVRRKKQKKLALMEQSGNVMLKSEGRSEAFAADAGGDTKPVVSEDEVEIWIPNKKYKGPLRDQYAALAAEGSGKVKCPLAKMDRSTPFMTFISVDQTPTALVRRRNKLSQSEPKRLHKSSKVLASTSPRSAGRQKKVKFAMNLNKSQDFEDSLNMTPRQAYNPSLQPDRTILKPSPDTSRFDTPTAMKQKSLRKRPHAADFF